MAQWVTCLQCEHEDQGLGPQHPDKCWAGRHGDLPMLQCLGGRGRSQNTLASWLAGLASCVFKWETLPQQIRGTEQDIHRQIPASTHVHMHKLPHIQTHTHHTHIPMQNTNFFKRYLSNFTLQTQSPHTVISEGKPLLKEENNACLQATPPLLIEHPGRSWLRDLHAFLNSQGHELAGALLFSTK